MRVLITMKTNHVMFIVFTQFSLGRAHDKMKSKWITVGKKECILVTIPFIIIIIITVRKQLESFICQNSSILTTRPLLNFMNLYETTK